MAVADKGIYNNAKELLQLTGYQLKSRTYNRVSKTYTLKIIDQNVSYDSVVFEIEEMEEEAKKSVQKQLKVKIIS